MELTGVLLVNIMRSLTLLFLQCSQKPDDPKGHREVELVSTSNSVTNTQQQVAGFKVPLVALYFCVIIWHAHVCHVIICEYMVDAYAQSQTQKTDS